MTVHREKIAETNNAGRLPKTRSCSGSLNHVPLKQVVSRHLSGIPIGPTQEPQTKMALRL